MNRRLVRDRLLLHAISEAYRNVVPPATFPVVLLFVDLPYEEVDVNVHPAKIEVRFRHPQFVHDFTRDAIRQALSHARPIASFGGNGRTASSVRRAACRGDGRGIRRAVICPRAALAGPQLWSRAQNTGMPAAIGNSARGDSAAWPFRWTRPPRRRSPMADSS